MLLDEEDRAEILRSYVIAHLEEEIRREALVKDQGGAFLRFLQWAAAESGQVVNYARIADDVGVARSPYVPTISYSRHLHRLHRARLLAEHAQESDFYATVLHVRSWNSPCRRRFDARTGCRAI